ELGVAERTLKRRPRLRLSKGEAPGVQATAARAGEDFAHADAVLAERLADALGLGTAIVVEIALCRAVVQSRPRRIEATRRVAVGEHGDGAGRAQCRPERVGILRPGGAGAGGHGQ